MKCNTAIVVSTSYRNPAVWLCLPFFIFLDSCSLMPQRRMTSEAQSAESGLASRAQKNLESHQFAQALEEFREAQKQLAKGAGEKVALQLQLGEAESLQGLGRCEEAIVIFKSVIERAFETSSGVAGVALLRGSSCYEVMGENTLALASLKDAESRSAALTEEERKIELPYRLGSIMIKLNKIVEAKRYFRKVEESIAPYLDPQRMKSPWIGPVLLQLSQVGSKPAKFEDYLAATLQAEAVQKYLIRCMELQNEPSVSAWSELCFQTARESFFDFYKFIHRFRDQVYADSFVSNRQELEKKVSMAIDLKSLIAATELQGPLDEKGKHPLADQFFDFIAGVDKELSDFLHSTPELTALTEESKKLNALRREGRVKE